MATSDQQVQALARVIRGALATAGVQQTEAATKTGIPLGTLRRRLAGGTEFTVHEFFAIADVVGVPASELVERAQRLAEDDAA